VFLGRVDDEAEILIIVNHLYFYNMTTITLQIPDSLGEHENETVRFIAAKLYESAKLSLGQAAEMVGLSKRTHLITTRII
jgi:predicted HTH domain antitoxin